MVELSYLYGLNLYTIKGKYVGRVEDVVLNIKKGRVSTLKVKALTQENSKNPSGFTTLLRQGFNMHEPEDPNTNSEEGMMDISYERVQAVGDILLITPAPQPKDAQEITVNS